MIDVADLPAPVQRAVANIPAEASARDAATHLRNRAAVSYQAIDPIWRTAQWHQIQEHLALMSGYLTAATRLEEETTKGDP